MYKKKEVGMLGENIATKYLEGLDYNVIERNFRCRSGEIDIIAQDKDEIVFVEVKTRISLKCGVPAEAVNKEKQEHLYKTASFYLYKHGLTSACVRFDVIEIFLRDDDWKLEHLKNIEITNSF